MSDQSTLNRKQLLRILALAAIAALALFISVGGMVAYSAHVIDTMQRGTETRLAQRRVTHTLVRMRDNVVSATVWNDAYDAAQRGDAAWMQINFGDYYADYMDHDVTVVFNDAGALVYASRDSEPVDPEVEAAFGSAVAPLAKAIGAGEARKGVVGLDAVSTREAIVMANGEPYFVAVSSIVREDVDGAKPVTAGAIVASGMKVASFVPSLTADLELEAPTLVLGSTAPSGTSVPLRNADGRLVASLVWTPSQPGRELLMGAIPALAALFAVLFAAVVAMGFRVYRLITELALNEEALDRSLSEAETANESKSQFLANMSHELRTPLNGIIAMTELLRARQMDERGREMADTIVASGRTLENVVNDILDISKIEAGQMRFEVAPFDLRRTVQAVADLHAAAAAAKDVRLILDLPDAAAGLYEGDRNRVSQIISNLLSNAVKFTDEGCVQVAVRNGPRGLRIAVSDSGVGFDRATARRLFQRFEQADVSVSRRFGGAGLGLSICESLARMMGGGVGVRSSPGRGSTFIVRLPLTRLGDAPTTADPAPPTEDLGDQVRVLFADDHAVNRQVVRFILEPFGVDLTEVENGALAVEQVRCSRFDIILMDVQMPVMDGLTATRQIRALEAKMGAARTPIISLTANAMPDDVARSLEAGSDLHLAKPVRPDALISAVQSLLAEPTPASATETPANAA